MKCMRKSIVAYIMAHESSVVLHQSTDWLDATTVHASSFFAAARSAKGPPPPPDVVDL
jgi:hypothetical protein